MEILPQLLAAIDTFKKRASGLYDPSTAFAERSGPMFGSSPERPRVARQRIEELLSTDKLSDLPEAQVALNMLGGIKPSGWNMTKDGRRFRIVNDEGDVKAIDLSGDEIGNALTAIGDRGPQVADAYVNPDWRRQGVASAMYDAAGQWQGKIVPSTMMSADAQSFWLKRDPAALRDWFDTEAKKIIRLNGSGELPAGWLDDAVKNMRSMAQTEGSKKIVEDVLSANKLSVSKTALPSTQALQDYQRRILTGVEGLEGEEKYKKLREIAGMLEERR